MQASVLCQDQNGLSVTDIAILEACAETMIVSGFYMFTNFLWHVAFDDPTILNSPNHRSRFAGQSTNGADVSGERKARG